MSDNTKISWADATWNPIRARLKADTFLPKRLPPRPNKPFRDVIPAGTFGYHCERVSPGCAKCYACTMNGRTLPAWGTGLDYTVPNREKVEIYLDEKELLKPLSWKRPRLIFPASMSDWMAEFVPDEFIDRMMAVMALTQQHKYLCLTKRAERLRKYMEPQMRGAKTRVYNIAYGLGSIHGRAMAHEWPFPNVWLGVSVEDRQRYRERAEHLRRTPAAIRWLSLEPLLEDLGKLDMAGISWVVVGGESGPGARPCNVEWVRNIIDQCRVANVPVYLKQLGAVPIVPACRQNHWDWGGEIGRVANFSPLDSLYPNTGDWRVQLKDRKGEDPEEWPEWMRVRTYPEGVGHVQ